MNEIVPVVVKPLITISEKNECVRCGAEIVALRIPLQISKLNLDGKPTHWTTIGVPLEEYLYCSKCRLTIPVKMREDLAVDTKKGLLKNAFGYI